MFSTVYRVIQKDFYARPYTSMWALVVARQISKRYSSSCQVFISIIDLRGLLENDSRTRSTVSSVTCCLGCFPDTYCAVSKRYSSSCSKLQGNCCHMRMRDFSRACSRTRHFFRLQNDTHDQAWNTKYKNGSSL
jgi:hypothetical protein